MPRGRSKYLREEYHDANDDTDNDGFNVLKVQGGDDAIVRTTPKTLFPGFGPWYSLLNMPASNDGDDTAMYWADVKVYDGIVEP